MNQSENTLPNLFIPGAAKSGTSTLHDYLSFHPDICMCPNKEPNYFWRTDKTLEDYKTLYSACADRKYRGDSSISYMVLPQVVAKIKSLVPDPRFILIFRNPIDRAWSHYWWARVIGEESCEFREALLKDVDVEPSVDLFKKKINKNYYQMSLYAKWLRLYYNTFGKDNILVLEFDSLISHPINTLDRVFDFLEIPKLEKTDSIHTNQSRVLRHPGIVKFHAKLTKFAGNSLGNILPRNIFLYLLTRNLRLRAALTSTLSAEVPPGIGAEQRQWLETIFREDVKELRQITGIAFESWENDFTIGASK